jgi:hypothetical protein
MKTENEKSVRTIHGSEIAGKSGGAPNWCVFVEVITKTE